MSFLPGFKRDCESLVAEVRDELSLPFDQPINMAGLFRNLGIPVHSLDAYLRASGQLRSDANVQEIYKKVSAFTFFRGSHRTVVYNEEHLPPRHRSNLAHELAHALLCHPPIRTGFSVAQEQLHEKEAAWLGGVLMLSSPQAHHIARARLTVEAVKTRYQLSDEMLRFRLNVTGASRLMRCISTNLDR